MRNASLVSVSTLPRKTSHEDIIIQTIRTHCLIPPASFHMPYVTNDSSKHEKLNPFGLRIVDNFKKERESFDVQCFPLYYLLAAVNRTTIDYFSLDAEGTEFSILKTIPWAKISFKVQLLVY